MLSGLVSSTGRFDSSCVTLPVEGFSLTGCPSVSKLAVFSMTLCANDL